MAVTKRKGLWNRLNGRSKNGVGNVPNYAAWFADLEDQYPNVREFLNGRPEVGEGIEGGTLQFFCDWESPKLRLSDRHNGQVAFVTGMNAFELLQAVEDALEGDRIHWREDRFASERKKRSKR